jgi:DNA-directed RNA polymerase subunit M/transcription elongation factor TFIIS
MIKFCPKCHVGVLQPRTDLPERIGWVCCNVCGYMEKEKKDERKEKKPNEEDRR